MTQQVQFEDLGNMPYKQAWDYQESLLKKNLEVKAALRVAADRQQALTTDDSRLTFPYSYGDSAGLTPDFPFNRGG